MPFRYDALIRTTEGITERRNANYNQILHSKHAFSVTCLTKQGLQKHMPRRLLKTVFKLNRGEK